MESLERWQQTLGLGNQFILAQTSINCATVSVLQKKHVKAGLQLCFLKKKKSHLPLMIGFSKLGTTSKAAQTPTLSLPFLHLMPYTQMPALGRRWRVILGTWLFNHVSFKKKNGTDFFNKVEFKAHKHMNYCLVGFFLNETVKIV